jgi:hypothetical protein
MPSMRQGNEVCHAHIVSNSARRAERYTRGTRAESSRCRGKSGACPMISCGGGMAGVEQATGSIPLPSSEWERARVDGVLESVCQGFALLPHSSGQAITKLSEKILLARHRLQPAITIHGKQFLQCCWRYV